LIIDELDKTSDPKDLSALLSWMESGRIVISKHQNHTVVEGKGWVFAAANRIGKIPPELLSRFLVFHLKEYSQSDYKEIVSSVLTKREGIEEEIAQYIADLMSKRSRDVRDAIKVARLAKTKEMVDKVLGVMEKYSDGRNS